MRAIRRTRRQKKLARVAAALAAKDALLISDPHAVAWVFNIRGHDVAHTPLPLAYALILKDSKPRLYADARKLDKDVRDKLAGLAGLKNRTASCPISKRLAMRPRKSCFDSATVPAKLTQLFKDAGGVCEFGSDPIS